MRRLGAAGSWIGGIRDHFATLRYARPVIEPSVEAADCGYVCISAVMALLGRPLATSEIKRIGGTTSRGLTLKQVRDIFRALDLEADVIFFDRNRAESFPTNGVVLLSHGHYVVIGRRRGDRLQIFDPNIGWAWMKRQKFARKCNGLAIQVAAPADAKRWKPPSLGRVDRFVKAALEGRTGRRVVLCFALAQLITLLLPLLSMRAVNESLGGVRIGTLSAVAIGFAAISLTNILMSLLGDLAQSRAKRIAAVAMSRRTFDELSRKPSYWFETNSAPAIQNRVGSLAVLLDFRLDAMRAIGGAVVTFVIGICAMVFVSPYLLIPGILALGVSLLLDLGFERVQRSHFASVVETSQRRQKFVLDTLSQIPVISRFGALPAAKSRFSSLSRGAEAVEAQLKSLKGWQAALRMLVKSGETLFFVIVAAAFMGSGHFSLGGFVAVGAYKDLIATSISSIFALHIQRRSLEVHRLQAASLLNNHDCTQAPAREITGGRVELTNVSFSYGSLDRPVLREVSLRIEPGECVILRGPSGSGKSTIAKIVTGSLVHTGGDVQVDGGPPTGAMVGMASVLQSDRLIDGTIRENVTFFRRNVPDEEVIAALRVAQIADFVLSLPMRLQTQIGEGMSGLSGGQRQRILIARAALGAPRLLVLDEATSSLEVAVEASILQRFRDLGTTMLLLAHRPEVWSLADRIYTLDCDGRLVEDTVRDELVDAERQPKVA
jgi:ATP-binding cassette subfamily B protein RaxB